MTQDNHIAKDKQGLWYTYFGKGGAGVFAFLCIIMLMTWLFSVLRWG